MKQNYEIPEVSVILFDNEDIVTTSNASITCLWSGSSSDNDIAWDILNK